MSDYNDHELLLIIKFYKRLRELVNKLPAATMFFTLELDETLHNAWMIRWKGKVNPEVYGFQYAISQEELRFGFHMRFEEHAQRIFERMQSSLDSQMNGRLA